MQGQVINTLEFDKLKRVLLEQARTPLGALLIEELEISEQQDLILLELRRVTEGVIYLREGTALDIHDLPDPRPALGKLNVADINLEPFEILNLLRLISVSMGLRETFQGEREKFPLLVEITATIPNLRALYIGD